MKVAHRNATPMLARAQEKTAVARRRSARRVDDVPGPRHEPTAKPSGFTLTLSPAQADLLHEAALAIAAFGGPQAAGSAALTRRWGERITCSFDAAQVQLAASFAAGGLPMLEFSGLRALPEVPPEEQLPSLSELEGDADCLYLASRNALLLDLAGQRPFAFDIDNFGRLVRLVANFRGGGLKRLESENAEVTELSSHTGRALGAHTEAPYHCCLSPRDGHSPAPSSLVLTARFNPQGEPTKVIPLGPVLDRIGVRAALALTMPVYAFSASDSFTTANPQGGHGVPILEVDSTGAFMVRFNEYRFSTATGAPEAAVQALKRLREAVYRSAHHHVVLRSGNAVVINNLTALHCRDAVRDNRRLLVRLFGYAKSAQPIVLSGDPLIVQG